MENLTGRISSMNERLPFSFLHNKAPELDGSWGGERTFAAPDANDSSRKNWSCPAYVPVSELIYAAFRSNAKGLLPPSDE